MGRKLDHARALYVEGIGNGDAAEAVRRFTGDRYTQHSTGVGDGPDGFVEFVDDFTRRHPAREIRIVRGFEDGDHAFIHAHQVLDGGTTQWVTMDFFLTDDADRMIEHWDVIAPYAASTPSGHTSVDGPTVVTDLDHTVPNKDLVRALIRDVLMDGGDPTRVDGYISHEQYVQHNAEVPDGLAPFRALVVAEHKPLVYDEIVLLVGCGNFVATLCKARWEDQPYAQADLFRIEDGTIVEHWDAAEAIVENVPSRNSGKF